MKLVAPEHTSPQERYDYYEVPENTQHYIYGTRGNWKKISNNPVITDQYGVVFDISVMQEEGRFKMWLSWRTKRCIAYSESPDGIEWTPLVEVLSPVEGSDWEADELNRPTVIRVDGLYKMWYSGQMQPYLEPGHSCIGYAESEDGIHWKRPIPRPVLVPGQAWERQALMCPHVMYDEQERLYKMWYSGGSNHEPDAIGYATSKDGIQWKKHDGPILEKNPDCLWEQHKVCACHVLKHKDYYYMFYVGHMHEERAHVGMARSRDGITNWERHPQNPLISPERQGWDSLSVYKPYVLRVGSRWVMWYNGALFDPKLWAVETIGIAYLEQDDFGFIGDCSKV